MDSPSVQATAKVISTELRRAGLRNVMIEEMPADGATQWGGWLMPLAWKVLDARLVLDAPTCSSPVLVDYATQPMGLALYSPSTPGGQWVEGPVVMATSVMSAGSRLRGAFLFLEGGKGSFEENEAAARAGALGMLVCLPNEDRKAPHYINYVVPPHAERPCVPCFSLSPEAGERVCSLIKDSGGLRLRARVRAQREPGTLPVISATLGTGTPSLYVCAHMDEPGAQDNASGVGVAIEAVRALCELESRAGFSPALRSVKVFFSTEVRGLQAWVNRNAKRNGFVAGLNLDMVGHDGVPMVLREGFRDQPHFAGSLLRDAARIADRLVPGVAWKTGANYVSDALMRSCHSSAHVSIEQAVDSTYHSAADVPEKLRLPALRWAGSASVAFLYSAMRMRNADVVALAKRLMSEQARECQDTPDRAHIVQRRFQRKLVSLRRMMIAPEIFGNWSSPEDLYRLGVRRSTGCWPEVEQDLKFTKVVTAPAFQRIGTRPQAVRPVVSERAARRDAERLVPQVLFDGFLSFEDEWQPERAAALKRELGLAPAWGTESWAWMLARNFRGKSTVAETVDALRGIGVEMDMRKAVALARHLVQSGKARWKPILTPVLLRQRLKDLGIKRGRILMVHCSLSCFGYIPGGSETLVNVLLDCVGTGGTLVMPVHSLNVLGMPPYDRDRSPSKVGAITEYFRTRPGVLRSAHPTHSVAAYGPDAVELTAAHKVDMSPLNSAGFWGKLVELEGDVLLLCPLKSATIFHVGEDWTNVPQPELIAHALGPDGRRRIHVLPHAPWHVDHFEKTMAQPLLRRRVMKSVELGDGLIFHGPARAMADISVRVNRSNPLVSLGRDGQCTCFYCKTLRKGMKNSKIVQGTIG